MTDNKPKTRAVLYARFSPRPNAAECESCQSQLRDLREYAWKRGYEIVGQFHDDALSGGDDWKDRPGMFDAASAAKRGSLFIVRAFDRLFRDTEKALVFKSMLEAKGVRIRSITEESACDNSPVGNLVATIFLAIAEYQRAMIRARTKAKMLDHQKNGRRMSKLCPYGTMPNPQSSGRLIADVNEVMTIETIRQWWVEGETLRGIARRLTQAGIQSRGENGWSHVTVRRILIREGVYPRR